MIFSNCSERWGHNPFILPLCGPKYSERTFAMNESTLENFRKLTRNEKQQIISLSKRLRLDYQLVFSGHHQVKNTDKQIPCQVNPHR